MAKKKYIETPDKMWQLFLEYAAHTKDHPITVKDFIGPKAITVHRELQKPLTMEGFENYVAMKASLKVLSIILPIQMAAMTNIALSVRVYVRASDRTRLKAA